MIIDDGRIPAWRTDDFFHLDGISAFVASAGPTLAVVVLDALGTVGAGIAATATVHVRFIPVLDLIVAGRYLAEIVFAHAARAISWELAGITITAGSTNAATVQVGFLTVLDIVVTCRCLADIALADTTDAVAADVTSLAVCTDVTRAAAIHVGLVAVPGPIVAGGDLADVILTDAAQAIGTGAAGPAVGTGVTITATVHIGLETVLYGVIACWGLADTVGTHPAGTLCGEVTASTSCAHPAATAAVQIGFVPIEHPVVTGCTDTDPTGTHITFTIIACVALGTLLALGTVGATAVDIGLIAIFTAIDAGRRLETHAVFAMGRETVTGNITAQSIGTEIAARPPAIYVGLLPVEDIVSAVPTFVTPWWLSTHIVFTKGGFAVVSIPTIIPVGAAVTCIAAAVDVGFVTIEDSVVASSRLADVVRTDRG